MATFTPRIRAGEPCLCKNSDPVKFRHYRNTDNVYIGKFCKKCHKEWLTEKYFASLSRKDRCDGPSATDITMDADLYLRKSTPQLSNTDSMVCSARIRAGEPCICMNTDPNEYTQYWDTNGVYIGKTCQKCCKQWFTKQHLITLSSGYDQCHGPTTADDTEWASDLYLRKPPKLDANTAFQVRSARTKIDLQHFRDILKPGDHISWHRKLGWWHHAIVREIYRNEITVIQWNQTEHSIQIVQETVPIERDEGLFNRMYRIDYPEEVLKANNTELVLARALSRIGDTGYWLPTDNCESFATYCKTGSDQSHQIAWLKGKVKEYLGEAGATVVATTVVAGCKYAASKVPEALGRIVPAEFVEQLTGGSNLVGAGFVFLIETGFVIWDISKAYAERKNGNVTRNDFVEATVRRLIEGLSSSGLTVVSSIAGAAIGSPLGPLGILVGGIIGGVIGGVLGKVIGTWLGSASGKAIAPFFKNDRAITNIEDLNRADHIVFGGWLFHPRCHAIMVKHNGKDKIKVIRNTYEKGVVYEWIQFTQPLYRVEYAPNSCCNPDTVIKNATSKMGKHLYSLAFYNCKTFARECKTLNTTTEEPFVML